MPQQLLLNLTSQQQYQCNILNNLNKYLLTKYKAHCIETFSYTMLHQIHMFIHECHAKIVRPMIFDSPKNLQQIYNYLKYYSRKILHFVISLRTSIQKCYVLKQQKNARHEFIVFAIIFLGNLEPSHGCRILGRKVPRQKPGLK